MVAWAVICFAHAFVFFQNNPANGEDRYAKNQNEQSSGQTLQEDRKRKICVQQIAWKSHSDQEIAQKKALLATRPPCGQNQYPQPETDAAKRVKTIYDLPALIPPGGAEQVAVPNEV